MKGKFIVTILGTDFKSETLSSTYNIGEFNNEIEEILIDLFKDEWKFYDPTNICVNLLDIEEIYNNYQVDKSMEVLIGCEMAKREIDRKEKELDEINLLIELQKKYPNVRSN